MSQGVCIRKPPGCPYCGSSLRELERVEAKHTPASVPEHVKGYSVTRSYIFVQCRGEGKHRMVWRPGCGLESLNLGAGPLWEYA